MKNADFKRPQLTLPNGADKLLLHSCCAPCSGEVMEAIQASGIDYTIFFYNPNIHPQKEYLIRKEENIRFAEKHGVPFVDADYDTDNWFERAKGMEWEPERGVRCTMCFDMRFERTALYAAEHGFSVISSSLGISRWKNMQQINDCGQRAGAHYPGMAYGTVAKLAMRQPFVLFKGLTFQKLCLPGAFRPGDHHNKMLRPGLCVVHASPQYL
ncbi:epoxyqueuosine reductase QueH [Klebsiella pneumoniae]